MIDGVYLSAIPRIETSDSVISKISGAIVGAQIEEIYSSSIVKDQVRAWKVHKRMTCRLLVLDGRVEFKFRCLSGIYHSVVLSNYLIEPQVLTIEPNIKFGFKGLSPANTILNLCDIIYDESEQVRLPCPKF